MDQSITNQLIIMESLCGRGLFLERGEGPVGEKEGEGLSTFFIYFFVVSLVSKSFLGFGFLVLTSLKCCFGGSRFFFYFFFFIV